MKQGYLLINAKNIFPAEYFSIKVIYFTSLWTKEHKASISADSR